MGRKDYRMIADIVTTILPHHERARVALRFCSELRLSNSRFDKERFLIACGVDTDFAASASR